MKALVALLAAVPLLAAGPVTACGTCAEDKVAATYDHAVVQRAQKSGQLVVYCEVQHAFKPDALAAAARKVRGVDPASVRVAAEPAALSFALDPRRQDVPAALRAIERGVQGVRLAVVQVTGGGPH